MRLQLRSALRPGRRGKLAVAAVAAALAGAAGLFAVVPNASAAIAGMQIVSANTVSNSAPIKRLQITCPADTVALGGDIEISGSNQVRISEIFPTAETLVRSKVTFAAVEPLEGVSANWSFSAKAVCAPQSSLPGYQYLSASDSEPVLDGGNPARVSTRDSNSSQWFCPEGKSLVGFGGRILSDPRTFGSDKDMSRVRLTRIQPVTAFTPPGQDFPAGQGIPRGVRVDGNGSGYDGTVLVQSAAICATTSQITLDESFMSTSNDSVNAKSASTGCDNGTRTIVSSGFAVLSLRDDGVLQNADLEIGVTALTVNRGLFPSVRAIARESATGSPDSWVLGAYVVCTN